MPPVTRSRSRAAQAQAPSRSSGPPSQGLFPTLAHESPPSYTLDLSLPASRRHQQIATEYRVLLPRILPPLFTSVLSTLPCAPLLRYLSQLFLRTLHSSDETLELHTYSTTTGVPMHILIAYNIFLDLMMGCISGGVQCHNGRILHFRNLDWGMDELRPLVITLTYTRAGNIVARSITYAGYIGVLTGVREGLSMSLNYRALSGQSWFTWGMHWVAIFLGLRPTISSLLRSILLSPGAAPKVEELAGTVSRWISAPCYLVFCGPQGILLLEKDYKSSVVQEGSEFLVVANHDLEMEGWEEAEFAALAKNERDTGMEDLVCDSRMRKGLVMKAWERRRRSGVRLKDVIAWLSTEEVTNESTHYSCVMDPAVGEGGGLVWCRWWREPAME